MRVEDAARILLRRRRMRDSLVGFAQSIAIPGAPAAGDDEELFEPVGTGMATHHRVMLEAIQKCMETPYGRLILMLPPGSAKALALDTPIPTPDGWRLMGDLRVGDRVFDENGQPCNVTWVSPVWRDREVYTVRTDCGDAIVADVDHEWRIALDRKPYKPKGATYVPRGGRAHFKIKETRDLVRARSKRPMIERAKALELPEANLPLDPYLLGVWLGDGTSEAGEITASAADMPWLRAQFEAAGFETRDRTAKSQRFGVAGLRGRLVAAGVLKNKHVPAAYLRGSRAQRLALLQGLVDTDGTVCRKRGCTTFTNTNRRLAEAVQELARSLGVKAGFCESRATLNGRDCGPVYRVSFYHAQAARMPRKAALCRDQQRTPNTYIDLERAKNCDTVCIEVDSPSHLFLCGRSMTPTHNSTYASAVAPAWKMAKTPGYQVILASYATELAKKHGRKARSIFKQGVVRDAFDAVMLDKSTSAAENWKTSNGSEYLAGGILSGITGNRADCLIGDDLIAGAQEADSPATRKSTWEAWEMDAMTRLKPRGSIILLGTRWHPLDPIGMVLPDDYKGESGPVVCKDGMTWYVLNIPAEAERADDPLGRKLGEMLWPEWFDAQHWAPWRKKKRSWDSLFQQRPTIGGGGSFKEEWIQWYEPGAEPEALNVYGFSDYAAPNPDAPIDDPDYIEHGVFGLDETGDVWVIGWWYDQCTTDKGMNAAINLIKQFSPRKWWNEKGPIWNAIANLHKEKRAKARITQAMCPHDALPSNVNKMLRAETFFGMCEQGRVHFPNTPWARRVVAQLKQFPVVAHDDAVDVCSLMGRALDKLAYAYVRRPVQKKGLVFGSWEWLTSGTETDVAPKKRTM